MCRAGRVFPSTVNFALCPAHQADLREHRQPLARANQGKGQWEHKLRLPHVGLLVLLNMFILAESDLFYPVCSVCPQLQVKKGRKQK